MSTLHLHHIGRHSGIVVDLLPFSAGNLGLVLSVRSLYVLTVTARVLTAGALVLSHTSRWHGFVDWLW